MRYSLRTTALLAVACASLTLSSFALAGPVPTDVSKLALGEGLSLRVFEVGQDMTRLPTLIEGQTGNVNKLVKNADLGNDDFGLEDEFYAELVGYIVIPETGEYEFQLFSDDGSDLRIGGELVINHDGLHGATAPAESFVELEAGTYAITIRMFDQAVDAAVKLTWRTPGSDAFVVVPSSALRTETEQVLVTSPGEKQFDFPTGAMEYVRRPGDRRPLDSVHPALDLTNLRPEGFEPKVGGIDFLPDGRMILCLWEPQGRVMILENVVGDDVESSNVKVSQFAEGLAEPLGIKVITGDDGEPRIFVLQKQELTELIDRDGDDVADVYRVAVSGWPVSDNFHEFAFGLSEKDGLLYANLAVAINPGGKTTEEQVPGRGTTISMDPESGTYEIIAAGLRTPNGIGIGVNDEIYLSDNQGDWLPSSKILHLEQDAFYNSRINPPNPLEDQPVTPPVVWLPHGEIGNSPTNIVKVPDSWGPYAGQMFHGDVTHGGVKRVDVEVFDGVYQGAVFRFSQGLESGTNRIMVGPDDDLYTGGIGSTGDWQQNNTKWFGLQKLSWNGQVPFEMLHVRPGTGGIEIEFTSPLASDSGTTTPSPRGYRIQQWRYEPTSTYGGPKIDPHLLDVEAVTVSDDRTRVWLDISDETPMKEGHVVYVLLRDDGAASVRGENDQPAWSTEAWYTLNVLPNRRPDFVEENGDSPAAQSNTQESSDMPDVEEGFVTLFDGTPESAQANWRGFKKDLVPEQWQVEDGLLTLTAGGGGDLITKEQYEDFDLIVEWNISEKGNSGIIYRVAEEGPNTEATYTTGYEMQILDDAGHPASTRKHLSGSIYDLYDVPDPSPVKPAGEWNTSRIVVKDGVIEHYLNDTLVGKTDLNSDDWKDHLAASKFSTWPRFGKVARGHIALQDHGNVVHFRNIRIKPLD